MGFSLLDYFNGNFSPSTQQVNEAAKYADDMYAQQSGGADIHNADYVKQMNEEAQRGNILNSAALNEYNSQTGSMNHIAFPGSTSAPQGQGGGVVPPSYSAAGIGQYGNGGTSYSGNDAALNATLNAANAGGMSYGTQAFRANNWASQQDLARQMGFDTSPYKTSGALQIAMDNQLKDYFMINGLSSGWNNTGDARQANATLYHRDGDTLNPLGTGGYHDAEKGNWIQEHPGILAPLGVAAGGLAAMYAGGGAAGAGGAASSGTGATATGTGAASSGGIGGSVANSLGLGSQWAALPSWGQSAVTNAAMGGLNSGLRGGNILQGALMGGLSGGIGGGLTSSLASNGVSQGLAGGLGRLGGQLATGAISGQNMGGVLQNSLMSAGTGAVGNALGFNAPITDNSLGAIMARMALQQGGSYLASQVDPRLAGLGGQGLASLYNRYA